MKMLTKRGYSFTTTAERMIVRDVSRNLCYIAFVYDTQLKSTAESSDKNLTYMLMDEHIITVGAERFRFTSAVPALFHGYTSQRNPRHFFPKCDVDIRKESYADVVLPNGTTMFQRIIECMTKELTAWLHPR